jgi:hypothetical protein
VAEATYRSLPESLGLSMCWLQAVSRKPLRAHESDRRAAGERASPRRTKRSQTSPRLESRMRFSLYATDAHGSIRRHKGAGWWRRRWWGMQEARLRRKAVFVLSQLMASNPLLRRAVIKVVACPRLCLSPSLTTSPSPPTDSPALASALAPDRACAARTRPHTRCPARDPRK